MRYLLCKITYKGKRLLYKVCSGSIHFFLFYGWHNFVDMAYLSEKNIIEGRFIYYRKKTSKLINLPLQERAMMVLKRYKNNSQGYLFPILSKEHQIEQQKLNRLHKVITKANRALKAIGKELNISIKLTAYTTRHSYATSVCCKGTRQFHSERYE